MSRVICAQDQFDNKCPFNSTMEQERKITERVAKQQKVGARWDEFDEIEFFPLEEDQEPGFYDSQ